MKAALSRAFMLVVALALLTLVGTLGWLKWHEDELVFRAAGTRSLDAGQLPAGAERIRVSAAGGYSLAAVLMPAKPALDSGFWVLHLHGNAESAFSSWQVLHELRLRAHGLNVLAVDYRGFGQSSGVATESHMDDDAEAAYQELIRRGVPPQRIIIWGHSLGSGPAVFVASRHRAAALILFGAFTSIPDAAADTYSYLPVRWLVGIHFNSLQRLTDVHMPVVIAHAVGDRVIPFHHALQLFAAAKAPKRLLRLDEASRDGEGGHMDALYDHLERLLPLLHELAGVSCSGAVSVDHNGC
jgi:pimeloyl-ACP methyl ester carboxylesterase